MIEVNSGNWQEANRKYLMAAVTVVKSEIEAFSKGSHHPNQPVHDLYPDETVHTNENTELSFQPALDRVVALFGLSSFEHKILLMCAGVELDSEFAALIAGLQGNASRILPAFSLAMAVFPDAHWSALSPDGPLRYWQLIEMTDHQLITGKPIRIDEQLLHYITGISCFDERFNGMVEPVFSDQLMVTSHRNLAETILQQCTVRLKNSQAFPAIEFKGSEAAASSIAQQVSMSLGRQLYTVSATSLPTGRKELSYLLRLLNRESAIHGYSLILKFTETDTSDKYFHHSVQYFTDNFQGLIFLSSAGWSPKGTRDKIIVDVLKPTRAEQYTLWKSSVSLNENHLNGELDRLVSQFNLDAATIRDVTTELGIPEKQRTDQDIFEYKNNLWKLCVKHSRPEIGELAQRIEPFAHWNDIVLPEAQKDILKEIAIQVKNRRKVYDEWGFAGSGSRGLGISALFTGESGTGKTMAAEVLANELKLDLYRIDLSQVVNKYIGETEKNLRKIFDAAEDGGAILLFDEADALFGKRSEVKDSHDRYGNIEVSYLLQRMEAYRGLAILTTNMKSALDKAFLRRIRFIVQFPFPGIAQRMEIWGKVFPSQTPIADLDIEKLSKLNLPGGNIRNIAMNAAFLAAGENLPVGMPQVLRAARSEYSKLEKAMNNIETENL